MSLSRSIWKMMRNLGLTQLILMLGIAFSTGANGAEYVLGVDSLLQENVPKGTVVKKTWSDSRIYPGTTRDYWVYVPAQYDDAEPACVMVFQDGAGYVNSKGAVRAPTVFDNLIHKGDIPVIIGIFINPGQKEVFYDRREMEYVTSDDTYARFLLEEILPEVGKDYNLVDNGAGRAICGMSDGGLCAFTAAWERPDAFSKVISHVGSYTGLRGGAAYRGSEYPYLIRETRGNPKPIRVFLQTGENDLNILEGSWMLGNIAMASAMTFSRYDYRFVLGTGGHDTRQGGAMFPETLRWIWRDYPGVKGAGAAPDLDAVVGRWDVQTNILGRVSHSVLTVAAQDGALTAILSDEENRDLKVTRISFEDDILSYEYQTPQSEWSKRKWSKEKGSKDKLSKEKGSENTMLTWLKVTGNTFEGAVSNGTPSESKMDFFVKGRKKDLKPDTD